MCRGLEKSLKTSSTSNRWGGGPAEYTGSRLKLSDDLFFSSGEKGKRFLFLSVPLGDKSLILVPPFFFARPSFFLVFSTLTWLFASSSCTIATRPLHRTIFIECVGGSRCSKRKDCGDLSSSSTHIRQAQKQVSVKLSVYYGLHALASSCGSTHKRKTKKTISCWWGSSVLHRRAPLYLI